MGPEWIVVGIIAVAVLFGAKKIPDIARNVGRAQGEFKKGMREDAPRSDPAGGRGTTQTGRAAARTLIHRPRLTTDPRRHATLRRARSAPGCR